MEDDDEFGDLYADVLRPFQSSSANHPWPIPSKQPSPNRRIDLNMESEDEEILYGAPNSNPKFNFSSSDHNRIAVLKSDEALLDFDCRPNLNLEDKTIEKEEGLAEGASNLAPSLSKVLEMEGDIKLQGRGSEDPNLMGQSGIDVAVEERDVKDEALMHINENLHNFDIEEVDPDNRDLGSEAAILGLSIPGNSDAARGDPNSGTPDEATGEGDEWDSESEDDLQIVLNDNNHGPTVMGSDDDDEDGDPLVIIADSEAVHQPMEVQEWSEDAAQAADGERKDLGDATKFSGVAVVPKIGYSNHAYHPYHSQFKYVRPGASVPGALPVGPGIAPGQVRPPVNGPIAGRGRGDWRPTGVKSSFPVQKSFQPGYGVHVWGNNASGRGFGSGLEFTLPSHKTIFEIDIDSFEEKPWRLLGIDKSDFFNFGLNEESWKEYWKHLEQIRLEKTMQSKIRVYESGRTEQEYDPDLPPELAVAASIHDISSENANHGKMDGGQRDTATGSAPVRPQLPTGRAIQVETGYGERFPSIDTRPPRIRDSDSIIEIILQDSADDDSFPENGVMEQPGNLSREEFKGHVIEEDAAVEGNAHFDGFALAYNGSKRELVGKRAPFVNTVQDNLPEGDGVLPSLGSRGQISAYPVRDSGTTHEERRRKGRAGVTSPSIVCSGSTLDCYQKEDSVDSTGGKHGAQLSSPVTVGSAEELDNEDGDGLHNELVLADGRSGMDSQDIALDHTTTATDACEDENPCPSLKKQKLSSQVEQSSLQEIEKGGDLKAARSSENGKARSGSSRDYPKLRDSADEEVVQHGRSTRVGNVKRPRSEDEQIVRRIGRDERHGMEKHRSEDKGREDSYSRRNGVLHSAHHLYGDNEGIDRRKERDNPEGAWQWRDDHPHGRRAKVEDLKKREHGEEIGLRHQNKVRQSERMDKDEYPQLRKQLDNDNSRGRQERDVGSQRIDVDDNLKSQYGHMNDLHSKRRKVEEHSRRDAEKEEILHGSKENTNRRKRERDDDLDLRKRDDQVRTRNDDLHSVRYKEESLIQRERIERQREQDELHRTKKSHEESLSKQEREGRGVRSGRAAEDKVLASHARLKDEFKGSDRDYQFKDTGRQSEQPKRRDRVEDGSHSQPRGREDFHLRGNQFSADGRSSRQEKARARSNRAVSGSDDNRVHEKKHKENTRKSKEAEGGYLNSMGPSKRNQEDQSGQTIVPVISKGTTERGNFGHEIPKTRQSSRIHREDGASDNEQQDLRRGRSKLERWTNPKERDFSMGTKESTSLKAKQIDRSNNNGASLGSKLPDESLKMIESNDNHHPSGDQTSGDPDPEDKIDDDAKHLEDRHLDTATKLKQRSERFKLPMPSEKEAVVIKKMESEPMPSGQGESRADPEIKPERPARKRRWVSN